MGKFSAYSYADVQKVLRFALGTLRTAFPTRFCYLLDKLKFAFENRKMFFSFSRIWYIMIKYTAIPISWGGNQSGFFE